MLIKMSKAWLLKILLYVMGIRFYKTDTIPKSREFKNCVFQTVEGHQIQFFFYKEDCEDLIFKFGRIRKKTFTGYIIQAKFDEDISESLQPYNNLKFFFNNRRIVKLDENTIVKVLLSIYLDFIKHELSSKQH